MKYIYLLAIRRCMDVWASVFKTILCILLAWHAGSTAFAGDPEVATKVFANETAEQRAARLAWWYNARFGMFIHWGLYSQAAGEWNGKSTKDNGEWIMYNMQIPDSQYAKLVSQFNPVKFNARQWVRLAKSAGMKYIVITAKHHDGFGMFRSDLTDWCIKSTPFQRDPLKELAEACQVEGIKLCFYYSIMDWHHPDYAPRKSWNDLANLNPDFDKYDAYMKGQLKELLTRYGPIGILWFDGEWDSSWTSQRGKDLYNYVRSLQPDIIVNNRVGKARAGMVGMDKDNEGVGDYGTPEQQIPATGFGPGVFWESCMTMNDTWGYKSFDNDWKSADMIIRNLIDCASKGGNYLLNVGPTGDGVVPEPSVALLQRVGAWMKENHESIYGTTASPFSPQLPWGRCTRKDTADGTILYLHVFDWPKDGKLFVPGLKNEIVNAYVLGEREHEKLSVSNGDNGVSIFVPDAPPNELSSTIIVRIKGALEIETPVAVRTENKVLTFDPNKAKLHGGQIACMDDGSRSGCIAAWVNPNDWAEWEFEVKHPGKFLVTADIGAPASGSFAVEVGGQTLKCVAPNTGDYNDHRTVELGKVDLASVGEETLSVRAVKEGWQPFNLKAVRLTPIASQ